ncbi:MAG: nucleotidyl transferase AbiEii/AbiGii toxin family protein [Thermoproteales archaeon]|nr:nucleotidyl transferase AbiEii/AbiGii toxin family protein [Thermoproteales archaeon]
MEELIRKAGDLGLEPENVIREAFQKLILYAIAYNNLDDYYVLQGGTALRLFYNSPRYSLDLDFTLINSIKRAVMDFEKIKNTIAKVLSYEGVNVVKRREKIFENEGFYRLFLDFDTTRLLDRRIRIKIEVYEHRYEKVVFDKKILDIDYPLATSVGIIVKKPQQLLADKISSLAGGEARGYIRWRDVFDIYWLVVKLKAGIDKNYLLQEFGSWIEKPENLEKILKKLETITREGDYSEILKELQKLLPPSLSKEDMVKEYVKVSMDILNEALMLVRR